MWLLPAVLRTIRKGLSFSLRSVGHPMSFLMDKYSNLSSSVTISIVLFTIPYSCTLFDAAEWSVKEVYD